VATKVIFLKSGSTFTLPSDYVSFLSVEALGGGGGAGVGSSKSGGAGSGAYVKSTTMDTTGWTAGVTTLYYNVGAGGTSSASPTSGGTTWFSNTNFAPVASSSGVAGVRAAPGVAPSGYLRGAGGGAAQSTGDVRRSGTLGGSASSNSTVLYGFGGGGGAPGPYSVGGFGGSSDGSSNNLGNIANGGGGGAGSSGGAGSGSGCADSGFGGDGGYSSFNQGGNGATQYTYAGNGILGSGGGGGLGNNSLYVGAGNGGNGSADSIWTQTSNGETAGNGSGPGGGFPAGHVVGYGAGMAEYFDLESEANARIIELESAIMVRNAGRFKVTHIINLNPGEQWEAVTDESPEDGTYLVFIGATATHEKFTSKTDALAKNQALKDEFLATAKQTPVLTTAPVQPKTTGTQEL
jgi:hypothetical protein